MSAELKIEGIRVKDLDELIANHFKKECKQISSETRKTSLGSEYTLSVKDKDGSNYFNQNELNAIKGRIGQERYDAELKVSKSFTRDGLYLLFLRK